MEFGFILTLGLDVMSEEASLLSLQVNWAKTTKIRWIEDVDPVPQVVHVGSSQVEVYVDEFTYLGAWQIIPSHLRRFYVGRHYHCVFCTARISSWSAPFYHVHGRFCLLYTSDAADE